MIWIRLDTAQAQERRPLGEVVRLTGQDECMHHDSIVNRLTRWLGTDGVDGRIEVALDVAGPSFRVHRPDGTAQRSLAPLYGDCESRLDAVTLAMALAIDHTLLDRMEEDAADDGSSLAAPAADPRPLQRERSRRDQGASREPGATTRDPAESEVRERPEVEAGSPADASPPLAPAEPSSTEDDAQPPSVAEDTQATVDTPPGAHDPWRIGGFAELGAAVHAVPGWGLSVAAGLFLLNHRGFSVRLGGLRLAEGVAPLGSGTAHYRIGGARADMCGERSAGPIVLGLCAGMGAGRVHVEGRGFRENLSANQPWLAVVGRASATYAVGPVGLGIAGDVLVPAVRRSVQVEGAEGEVLAVREPSPVGAALWLTVSVTIP